MASSVDVSWLEVVTFTVVKVEVVTFTVVKVEVVNFTVVKVYRHQWKCCGGTTAFVGAPLQRGL